MAADGITLGVDVMRAMVFKIGILMCLWAGVGFGQEEARMEEIVLGGGCFWCLDAVYRLVPGVTEVTTGYSGGHTKNPDYKSVCTGATGHAEVVRVRFDPAGTSLDALLDLFWRIHDPTTLNRQGADVGTQYRSVIYYGNEAHKAIVVASVKKAGEVFRDPIVTEVAALDVFHEAEEYHQDYFNRNPNAGYCAMVIAPKVRKAKDILGK
jgi:peptide-methionine (S)-S-oxide reductase